MTFVQSLILIGLFEGVLQIIVLRGRSLSRLSRIKYFFSWINEFTDSLWSTVKFPAHFINQWLALSHWDFSCSYCITAMFANLRNVVWTYQILSLSFRLPFLSFTLLRLQYLLFRLLLNLNLKTWGNLIKHVLQPTASSWIFIIFLLFLVVILLAL